MNHSQPFGNISEIHQQTEGAFDSEVPPALTSTNAFLDGELGRISTENALAIPVIAGIACLIGTRTNSVELGALSLFIGALLITLKQRLGFDIMDGSSDISQ